MNRRARMLEALGVSNEWRLRGVEPPAAPAIEAEMVAERVEVAVADEPAPLVIEPPVIEPRVVVSEAEPPPMAPPAAPVADIPVAPELPRAQRIAAFDWAQLEAAVSGCTACKLCERRTQTVFGVGDRQADWMLIGEAPGEQEDRQGEPFVGQAGKLLDSMLRAVGLSRETGVFIANVLKCRPPGNRDPEPDEVAMCDPYLKRQIALVKPCVIIVLGRFAAQSLLQTQTPVGKLRGRVHEVDGVPVVVTYHPAYLLRTLTDKARAWEDLCLARKVYAERGGT
ncbi:uracil-DNA glycosylase family protein [Ralstonia solanacearum P673]|uniref:uracil-DNA glycosylase n=1 Tax=Ralstonia solanacearum TaxID=305 RepID=UPI0004B92E8D|nr:uracil-DNA glycosylase [Ralstonia solanacearum]MCL9850686.1 uracil-DNA glycosylase [Ralstonia solanacearum]MCL9854103.1 uracil-DNA glycosylase [Ralstonia solanacearum]MCL9859338.1 uracil-DNA glycosylase [Ralstonia solanacearum]MCL9864093.1 uracil-DNA glycosylase [Ralstonia solanacearum]MCL9868273.1 uracil-DNA glycosylase [Ralstonia solanacearum]